MMKYRSIKTKRNIFFWRNEMIIYGFDSSYCFDPFQYVHLFRFHWNSIWFTHNILKFTFAKLPYRLKPKLIRLHNCTEYKRISNLISWHRFKIQKSYRTLQNGKLLASFTFFFIILNKFHKKIEKNVKYVQQNCT